MYNFRRQPLLLGDKLFEIMDILHEDGVSFVVITNALLLTKKKLDVLKKLCAAHLKLVYRDTACHCAHCHAEKFKLRLYGKTFRRKLDYFGRRNV